MDELPSQSRRNAGRSGLRDELGSVPEDYSVGPDPLRTAWQGETANLADDRKSAGKTAGRAIREIVETMLLAALIFFGVRLLVLNFKVDGSSMQPNLQNNELLLVNRNAYEDIDLNDWLNKVPFVDRDGSWVVYEFDPPERGDIVVFNPPNGDSKPYIKRVIAEAGETVEVRDGNVYINGIEMDEAYIKDGVTDCGTTNGQPDACDPVVVPEGSVYVLGDNRRNSTDSRVFGPVPIENIIGKAIISYWPLEEIGRVPHHDYPDFTE